MLIHIESIKFQKSLQHVIKIRKRHFRKKIKLKIKKFQNINGDKE